MQVSKTVEEEALALRTFMNIELTKGQYEKRPNWAVLLMLGCGGKYSANATYINIKIEKQHKTCSQIY